MGKRIRILEVGCGHGYVASFLKKMLSQEVYLTGMDISQSAISKAQSLHPDISFIVGDIKSTLITEKPYDIIIMSQILWYIIDEFPDVFKNISKILGENGYCIFVNAFIRNQQYGNEIVDGFDGLIRYVLTNYFGQYRVVNAELDVTERFIHNDGRLVLNKCC